LRLSPHRRATSSGQSSASASSGGRGSSRPSRGLPDIASSDPVNEIVAQDTLVEREAVHRFESVEAIDDRCDLADRQPQERGRFVLELLETLSTIEEPCASFRSTGEDVLIVHRSTVAIVVIELISPFHNQAVCMSFTRGTARSTPIAGVECT